MEFDYLVDKSVGEYIDLVDARTSAPGGGSVAALVGALGASLARMLGHFSADKEKFTSASKDKQDEFCQAMSELLFFKDNLIDGIDEDAISYQAIVAAYKTKNQEEIQGALLTGCLVAYQMEDNMIQALENAELLVELGNKRLYSDLISAAILLVSGIEMASLNVKANANLLDDEYTRDNYIDSSNRMIDEAKEIKERILKAIG